MTKKDRFDSDIVQLLNKIFGQMRVERLVRAKELHQQKSALTDIVYLLLSTKSQKASDTVTTCVRL